MNYAKYSVIVESKTSGKVINYKEGVLADDKFQALVQGDGLARISTTYQRSLPYGEEKVSVLVSVSCDQNEEAINKAGEVTFMKALELVSDGWGVLEQSNAAAQQQALGERPR